ncbi:MerR family transcriptional regulator [Bacillus sp. FJAT-49736]|uniref:MerR family transcriptional regulator n=1 Tax=Bacillus sp. FJAT-49736 TaxID=2833582 RepID=UPI001BC958A9|nr:MerR family transcriptional regulator [Bacillus sp. FJAT-49736]MBS4172612.1 MerR family transcriptional regulator [Bacillus sp. FJAT-49736]
MTKKEIRRSMAILPISTVMQLTELSARQIRYYEEHQLISPSRSEGNRRLYSLNDVDMLLEIKEFLDQGINMAGIKQILAMKVTNNEAETAQLTEENKTIITDEQIRRVLREEMLQAGRFQRPSMKQNEVPRFYH